MFVSHNASRQNVRKIDGSPLTFLVVGEWGRNGMCCQRDVFAKIYFSAVTLLPQFFVSVGDIFMAAMLKPARTSRSIVAGVLFT